MIFWPGQCDDSSMKFMDNASAIADTCNIVRPMSSIIDRLGQILFLLISRLGAVSVHSSREGFKRMTFALSFSSSIGAVSR